MTIDLPPLPGWVFGALTVVIVALVALAFVRHGATVARGMEAGFGQIEKRIFGDTPPRDIPLADFLVKQLETLETGQAGLRNDLLHLNRRLDESAADRGGLHQEIGGVKQRVGVLEADVEKLRPRVDSLKRRVFNVERAKGITLRVDAANGEAVEDDEEGDPA